MKCFHVLLINLFLLTVVRGGGAAEIKVPQDYSTIQDAVNAAKAGDTVLVTDKRKYDTVLIEKDISLIANPSGVLVIGKIKGALVIRGNARKVTIQGFEFQAVESGIIVSTSDDLELTLVDVTASQCERGLDLHGKGKSHLRIQRCSFVNNKEFGFFSNRLPDMDIQASKFNDNGKSGLYIGSKKNYGTDSNAEISIRDSIFANNGHNGLDVSGGATIFNLTNVVCKNNSRVGAIFNQCVKVQLRCVGGEFEGNRLSGVSFAPPNVSASYVIDGVKAANNGSAGASFLVSSGAYELYLSNSDFRHNNYGLTIRSESKCEIENCSFIQSKENGLLLGFPAGRPMVLSVRNSTFDQNVGSPVKVEEPFLLKSDGTARKLYVGDSTYCFFENDEFGKIPEPVQCGFADLNGYIAETEEPDSSQRACAQKMTQLWTLLHQSQCTAQLGTTSQQFQELFNSTTRQVWQALTTNSSEMEIIPSELRKQYEYAVSSASSRSSSQMAGSNANDVTARMRLYKLALSLDPLVTLSLNRLAGTGPDFEMDWSSEKFRSSVVQDFLSEYILYINQNISPTDFQEVIEHARLYILRGLSDEEKSSALLWLSENVLDSLKRDSAIYSMHYNFMADSFSALGDSTNETKALEALLEGKIGKEDLCNSSQRLSRLYLEYWKVPEKAEELQRDLIHRLDNGKEKYEAVLHLSKLLFESKKFEKCIFEMERLLTVLPEDYDAASVRTMLGLAYMSTGDYGNARAEFADVINTSRGPYQEKCFYLLGYSFICEQKYQEAVKPFKDLLGQYPQSEYAAQAESFLNKIKDGNTEKK